MLETPWYRDVELPVYYFWSWSQDDSIHPRRCLQHCILIAIIKFNILLYNALLLYLKFVGVAVSAKTLVIRSMPFSTSVFLPGQQIRNDNIEVAIILPCSVLISDQVSVSMYTLDHAECTRENLLSRIATIIDEELARSNDPSRPLLRIEAIVCVNRNERSNHPSYQRRILVCTNL